LKRKCTEDWNVNARSLAINLKIAEWSCYKFAQLGLVRLATGILIFCDEKGLVTPSVPIVTDYVLRSLIEKEVWSVPSL
jgi:hypothetical protein